MQHRHTGHEIKTLRLTKLDQIRFLKLTHRTILLCLLEQFNGIINSEIFIASQFCIEPLHESTITAARIEDF